MQMPETLEFVLVVGALPNPSSPDPEQRFPVLLSISVPKNCEHELNETQSPQPSTPGRQRPENRFTTWSETVGPCCGHPPHLAKSLPIFD